MLERGSDGRERLITATLDPNVSGIDRWRLELTHPSGWSMAGSFSGPRVGVGAAMDSMLAGTRQQFRDEGLRGDRRAIELDPLRGSVGLPSAPIMTGNAK
jgi:hypothetical protein